MFRYLHKPIQRFVEYGDPANVNIAERFLDMANRWDEDDPVIWRQWGLPQYMVDAFRRHVKDRNESTIRRSWSATFKERPYLYFDLQQTEVPLLHIPTQQIKSAVDFQLKWTDLQGLDRDTNLRINATTVEGIHYTEPQDLDVGPCADGLCLEATDRSTGLGTRQSIHDSYGDEQQRGKDSSLHFQSVNGQALGPRWQEVAPGRTARCVS